MSQKISYYIAAGIAAFMLFTAGGLIRTTTQSQIAAPITTTSAPLQFTFTHETEEKEEHDDHHDDNQFEHGEDESRG